MGPFRLLSKGDELPVFAFELQDGVTNYTVYDLAAKLRERGWLVPSYSLPADLEDTHVIRLVIRNGFSRDMADILLADIARLRRLLRGPVAGRCRTTPRTRPRSITEPA